MGSKRGELLKRLSGFKTVPGHGPKLKEMSDEQLELRVRILESMFELAFAEKEDENDLSDL